MHELVGKITRGAAPLREMVAQLLKTRKGFLACAILVVLVGAAIFGPLAAPHDPTAQNLARRLEGVSGQYPLGTDELGRCMFSRMLYGARISIATGLIVVGVAALAGCVLGAFAGYIGGIADSVIMRGADIMLSFPGLVLAIVLAGALGPSLTGTMLALTLIHWTAYARLMRGSVLSVKEESYVEGARAVGAGAARVIFRHILPNCLSPVIVMVTFGLGHMILAAAALSFLGLGAQPPTAEWGAMLNRGRDFMRTAPQLMTYPGLAIMLSVLGFNLLGDALKDALTPREKTTGTWPAV